MTLGGPLVCWRHGRLIMMLWSALIMWSAHVDAQSVCSVGQQAGSHSYTGTVYIETNELQLDLDQVQSVVSNLFCNKLDETKDISSQVSISFGDDNANTVEVRWTLSLTQQVEDATILSPAVAEELTTELRTPVNLVLPTLSESQKTTFNTVMATIGAVSGMLVLGVMIWGMIKKLIKKAKEGVPKPGSQGETKKDSTGGNPKSGLFGGGGDEANTKSADAQGHYMPQAYVVHGMHTGVTPSVCESGLVPVYDYPPKTVIQPTIVYAVH